MAKKLRFPLLFYVIFINLIPVLATSEPLEFRNQIQSSEICDIPPPDSFRITNRAEGFIEVTWNPIFSGASHTLFVSINSSTNGGTTWISVDTIHNIVGTTYTILNIPFDVECRLGIATNCSSGEPSINQALIVNKVILELVLGARTPINPVPVNCHSIDFSGLENKWIGFKVSREIEGHTISNLFEFELTQEKFAPPTDVKVKIKRQLTENPIVAASDVFIWPTVFNPSVQSMPDINLVELLQNRSDYHKIGRVGISWNVIAGLVDMCVLTTTPWDDNYIFETMVDTKPNPVHRLDNSGQNSLEITQIKVQSPFNEKINMFMPATIEPEEPILFYLLNSNGDFVLKHQSNLSSSDLSLSVGNLPNGFYILHMEVGGEVYNFKVVKTD